MTIFSNFSLQSLKSIHRRSENQVQIPMSSAEKGTMEKMKASMLSINSKADKLIESQAALVALASLLVKKIVPVYRDLPNQSFYSSRSDPTAAEVEFLAAIEAAGGISEKTDAYLLSMNSKLDKGIESQTVLTALVKVLIEQLVCPKCLKKITDEAEKYLSSPLPPTMAAEGDVLAGGESVVGDVLAGGEAVGGITEKTDAYLLLMNSKLDKVVESQAAITDLVTVLTEQFACPDCIKQSLGLGKCPLAPLPPTVMSDPEAVGELTESLLKTKL